MLRKYSEEREAKKRTTILTAEAEGDAVRIERAIRDLGREMKIWNTESRDAKAAFSYARSWFAEKEEERQREIKETGSHFSNVFNALEKAFGEGQEMVLFLPEVNAGYYCLKYINECGNDEYYKYNKLLLLKERNDSLRREILSVRDQSRTEQ